MKVATFAGTLLLLIPAAVTAQQAPPSPETPGTKSSGAPGTMNQRPQTGKDPHVGSATIRGRVVRADTGEPLRRVQIRAMATESHASLTDSDGRYEIAQLPPGSHHLSASKGGFVEMKYGQRRPFRAGRSVALEAGALLEKIDFALTPGGVIAGRILDDAGEPIVGASVNVSRPGYVSGRRQLIASGGDRSDDRGEFRIFDLPPGDYYVHATLDSQSDGANLGYAATYYPGTPSHGEAQQVRLKAGEELSGIIFPLVTTRTASLSGMVRKDDGTTAVLAMVIARERPGDSGATRANFSGGVTRPDGSFVITSIPPGAYIVEARSVTDPNVASTAAEVVVNGQDISGLTLRIGRAATARGHIRFDTSTPPKDVTPERIRIFPMSLDPETFDSGSMPGPPREDWTFEITGLTGRRLIRGGELRGTWTIKSVHLEGTNVTDTPLDFTAGDVNGLDVLLTQQKTDLPGVVTNDRGARVADATVIAFADDPEKWGPATRFVESSRLDQNGHFRLQGLPAGNYVVVAVDDMEPGEERDPELLEQLRSTGERVTLREGETRTLDLKVVTY